MAGSAAAVLLAAILVLIRHDHTSGPQDSLRTLPSDSPRSGATPTPTPAPSLSAASTPVPSRTAGVSEINQPPATPTNPSDGAGQPLDAHVVDVALSADGRFLAFTTRPAALVPGDTNGGYDTFVRELATGRTVRASVDDRDRELPGGMKSPFGISLSADGSRVLFNNSAGILMVRDLATGHTLTVGHTAVTGSSTLSPDGGYVGFASSEDNIVSGDTNGEADAFVTDLATGTTERVSVASDGSEGRAPQNANPPGQTVTDSVRVSRGGTVVLFVSELAGLVGPPAQSERRSYAYLHHRDTGVTERLDFAIDASLTPDARWVGYRNGQGSFVWDTHTGQSEKVSPNATAEVGLDQISNDGRYVLDVAQTYEVRVIDRTRGSSDLIGSGDAINETAMSGDGTTIAFETNAPGRRHSVAMVCQRGSACKVATDP